MCVDSPSWVWKNNYFVARFGSTEDAQRVIMEGPQVMLGHYLLVEKWTLQFNPRMHVISSVLGWVQIASLYVHHQRRKVLWAISNLVGPIVFIDLGIESYNMTCYERIDGMLNMDNLFHPRFKPNGTFHRVIYERLIL